MRSRFPVRRDTFGKPRASELSLALGIRKMAVASTH
jgi:hypothetical protein